MDKERLFKRAKGWNTFIIVIKIITVIFTVLGLVSLYAINNSKEVRDQLIAVGTDMSVFETSTFDNIISIIILIITIGIIVMAIMNSKKMKNQELFNITPYILIILLVIYSVATTIISAVSLNVPGAMMSIIINMIISILINVLPSVIIISSYNKINNIMGEEQR
ncbi:hypothetical protein [Miniphocaeibacter halophilus]|uniref:Uncharacterized protein n=1 Tax=Miniphocaeibacter halophilus TaxID=2931922 RepID=A0AC61MP98_9FIRM|nr:hypothetical protein [Miniphocaeibacter halophilus]QQK07345.1 hypothetical protein JFY71_08465 [Miniphocaeibacter halophilus]